MPLPNINECVSKDDLNPEKVHNIINLKHPISHDIHNYIRYLVAYLLSAIGACDMSDCMVHHNTPYEWSAGQTVLGRLNIKLLDSMLFFPHALRAQYS